MKHSVPFCCCSESFPVKSELLPTRKSGAWKIATSLAMLLIAWSSPALAADKTAKELLSAYEDSLSTYLKASFTIDSSALYNGPWVLDGKVIAESRISVWRDGERWRIHQARTFQSPRDGKVVAVKSVQERLYPGTGIINVQQQLEPEATLLVIAHMDQLPESDRQRVYSEPFGVLYGRLGGSGERSLSEILKTSRLSARKEKLRGVEMWVLEGVGPWGTHRIWLDPTLDLLPRRIEQRKGKADWYEAEKPIRDIPKFQPPLYPGSVLVESIRTVDDIEYRRLAGKNVVASYSYTYIARCENGQSATFKESVKVTNVDLNPDFVKANAFSIQTPIPNGTRVFARDRKGERFEWRDGAVHRLGQ